MLAPIPYPVEIAEQDKPLFLQDRPTILSYSDAAQIRDYAESQADPYFYNMAAMAFDSLEMPAAAQRMRDRAKYYEAKS